LDKNINIFRDKIDLENKRNFIEMLPWQLTISIAE